MNIRILLLVSVLLHAPSYAQSVRGVITGLVVDSADKPLSGATVQLVQGETNRQRSFVTDEAGAFTISNLPPGEYRITAEREGFRRHEQAILLQLGQEVQLTIPLLPGQRTESVQVTAVHPVLRTESAALGGVIENRQITGLPLDGRNVSELSLLLPGVAPAAQGSAGSIRGDFAINVNGSREDSNSFTLDGIFNGDPKLNGIALSPPVDGVREFEVATNNYDALYGRNSGGQVNVVLKSGTNQFHGTVYEFFRNRALDARNFFAPAGEKSPQYQRNQFGASVGGPIWQDRTFFFADYEGRRMREGITRVTNVPTALERVGDFSRSPNLFAVDPFTQQLFPGNAIPGERLSSVGLAIAALYPLPNRSVPNQNHVSSPALRDRNDHFDARVDHSLGASDEFSFRYSFGDRTLYEPFAGSTLVAVPGYGNDVLRRAQNAMASHTHTFTPNLLNELRAGLNRVAAATYQENMDRNLNREVGLPTVSTRERDFGLTQISVTGFTQLGDEPHNPQHGVTNIFQLVDNVTWVRGRHLVRTGFDFRRLQQNAYRDEMSRGFITFLGQTGNALAEMLLGLPSLSAVARLDNPQHLRTYGAYGFVQDTWRLRPDVTISAGLRYEFNAPPVDTDDRANLYDPASRSLVRVGTGGIPRGGYESDRNNFAPRLGIAWRPRQGATVVRAGYGVYYDQSSLATGEGIYFSQPYFDFKLYFPLGPQLPLSLSDPFPAFFPLALPSSALTYQRDLRTPYTQHWNFSVQRELGRSRVLEVGYAGSKGSKLILARDLNQPAASPVRPNPRPVPQFDDINVIESRGNSNYHSLQTRFQQNLYRGMTALASYTWAKSIDDGSSFFTSAGDASFPQDSLNARAERGLSAFDLRQRLSLSYSYDLPLGRGRLLGGWQTFGIWTFQSGRPFTVALHRDLDNSNTGRTNLGFGANDRPDALRDPELNNPAPERWFDTAAFAPAPFGSFGNAGRNILTGPGYQNINVSIIKNTVLSESANLQFRAEAFNLFNHTNLDLPDIFLGSPTFGTIQSAGSPRRLQFGVKLLF